MSNRKKIEFDFGYPSYSINILTSGHLSSYFSTSNFVFSNKIDGTIHVSLNNHHKLLVLKHEARSMSFVGELSLTDRLAEQSKNAVDLTQDEITSGNETDDKQTLNLLKADLIGVATSKEAFNITNSC